MNPYRTFALSVAGASVIAFGAYYCAFVYQLGAPIPASYDVANWISLKENTAQNTAGHRVLLIGDSSGVFGMDSPQLEKELGRPVVNMTLHGGLPLDWITNFAERNVRSGDIVIMPLAWPYYFRDFDTPEDWMIDQIVAWDRDYFDSMSLLKKLKYLSAVNPQRLYDNLKIKIKAKKTLKNFPLRKILSPQEALKQYQEQYGGSTTQFSYSYLNMNKYGDMLNTCGNVTSAISSLQVAPDSKVNTKALQLLKETAKNIASLGGTLYIVPSITVSDSQSQQPHYEQALNSMLNQVKASGVNVLGEAKEFYFPPEAFFDTNFHLNCSYRSARTKALANILKPELKDVAGTNAPAGL